MSEPEKTSTINGSLAELLAIRIDLVIDHHIEMARIQDELSMLAKRNDEREADPANEVVHQDCVTKNLADADTNLIQIDPENYQQLQ